MSGLFGAHARDAIPTANPPQIADEVRLLKLLVVKVGPHANLSKLLYHLRSTRGKVPWAVNCYFRDVCEPTADSSDLWDFQLRSLLPKPVEPPREGVLDEATDAGCSEGVDPGIGIDSLPVPVLEHILRSVGAADVCNVAQTCKTLANAARSDLVWKHLYVQRWGVPPSNSVLASDLWTEEHRGEGEVEGEIQNEMRELFRQRFTFEKEMRCLKCGMLKVVPLIYGFPSPKLVQCMRAKQLMLGGDYLADGDAHMGFPCWFCTACSTKYTRYPHAPPPEDCDSDTANGLAVPIH